MRRSSLNLILCAIAVAVLSFALTLQPSIARDNHTQLQASHRHAKIRPARFVDRGKTAKIKRTQNKQVGFGEQVQTEEAIRVEEVEVVGVPIIKASVNLNDPDVIFTVVPVEEVEGAGGFSQFVRRSGAALVTNTTFEDPAKTNWTTISEGTVIEGRQSMNWSTGTVFALDQNNSPKMIDRIEGPNWDNYWFSITCLPRLLRNGIFNDTDDDNFSSPLLIGKKQRSAIGFSRSTNTLYHVITEERRGQVELSKLAEVMQSLGCDEAMNLEGGDGVLLAYDGQPIIRDIELHNRPVRAPVIVVYDKDHPAPSEIRESWEQFNQDVTSANLS